MKNPDRFYGAVGRLVVGAIALASDQERLGRPVACAMDVEQARFLELFTERVLQD